jgi:hypothetical protein
VDGEALSRSDKLAQVYPLPFRAEYAYLLTQALANGSFECDARKIWSNLYAYNRPDISAEMVAAILDEYERVKMLFRWRGEDRKVWGHWVGSLQRGRLPAASAIKKGEKVGLPVPMDLLEAFLTEPIASQGTEEPSRAGQALSQDESIASPPQGVSQEVPRALPGDSLAGFGSGLGKGLGLGLGSASGGSQLLSSLSSSDEDEAGGTGGGAPAGREHETEIHDSFPQDENAGGKPPSTPKVVPVRREAVRLAKRNQQQPAARKTRPAGPPPGPIEMQFGPTGPVIIGSQSRIRTPGVSSTPGERVPATPEDDDPAFFTKLYHREMHPPRISEDNFEPLDFAFTLENDFAGLPPKEVRRIVYYCFRASAKKKAYWSSAKANIDSRARLEQALPQMATQVPDDYYLSGSLTQPIPIADPACTKCAGSGSITIEHPAYPGAQGRFQASQQCECVKPHPAPWRLNFDDGKAA